VFLFPLRREEKALTLVPKRGERKRNGPFASPFFLPLNRCYSPREGKRGGEKKKVCPNDPGEKRKEEGPCFYCEPRKKGGKERTEKNAAR